MVYSAPMLMRAQISMEARMLNTAVKRAAAPTLAVRTGRPTPCGGQPPSYVHSPQFTHGGQCAGDGAVTAHECAGAGLARAD